MRKEMNTEAIIEKDGRKYKEVPVKSAWPIWAAAAVWLIAALILVGAFIGGVKDKKEWIRNVINRLFPPKQNIPYREQNAEIEKAVKEATENTQE